MERRTLCLAAGAMAARAARCSPWPPTGPSSSSGSPCRELDKRPTRAAFPAHARLAARPTGRSRSAAAVIAPTADPLGHPRSARSFAHADHPARPHRAYGGQHQSSVRKPCWHVAETVAGTVSLACIPHLA